MGKDEYDRNCRRLLPVKSIQCSALKFYVIQFGGKRLKVKWSVFKAVTLLLVFRLVSDYVIFLKLFCKRR